MIYDVFFVRTTFSRSLQVEIFIKKTRSCDVASSLFFLFAQKIFFDLMKEFTAVLECNLVAIPQIVLAMTHFCDFCDFKLLIKYFSEKVFEKF